MSAIEKQQISRDAVLAKAIVNVADQLGLKQSEISAAIGMHRTAFSKLKSTPSLDPTSKQGELALIMVRIARSLFALTGGDEVWIKRFMHTKNKITGGVPAQQIASIEGLMAVLRFVDAIRGKV
tara:strand:+ start:12470 stop:12841 length:372 start_codon:yes stop_codon:yes gene_type:complete